MQEANYVFRSLYRHSPALDIAIRQPGQRGLMYVIHPVKVRLRYIGGDDIAALV